jgi:hypothetical protein
MIRCDYHQLVRNDAAFIYRTSPHHLQTGPGVRSLEVSQLGSEWLVSALL